MRGRERVIEKERERKRERQRGEKERKREREREREGRIERERERREHTRKLPSTKNYTVHVKGNYQITVKCLLRCVRCIMQ